MMKKVFFVFLCGLLVFVSACGPNDKYKTRGEKVAATILSKYIKEEERTNIARPWIHYTVTFNIMKVSFLSGEEESSKPPLTKETVNDFIAHLGETTPSNYHTVEIFLNNDEYARYEVGDQIDVYYLKSDPEKVRTADQVEGPMVRLK